MNLSHLVLIAILWGCCLGRTCPPALQQQPFAKNGPWNTPIPENPKLSKDSANIVARLTNGQHPIVTQLYAYGMPIYFANSSTPRYNVTCIKHYHPPCDLHDDSPVPIPADAIPSYGSDRHLIVIDTDTCYSYEWWVAFKAANGQGPWGVRGNWGARLDLHSFAGTHNQSNSAVAAGWSALAGLGRVSDVLKGKFDHALSFTSAATCSHMYKYPASHSDGRNSPPCIQEGQRIQLDPTVDLTQYTMAPGTRMIAEALQKYGAYCSDTSGVNIGFYFEDNSHGRCHSPSSSGHSHMSRCPWWAKNETNPYYTVAGWDRDGAHLDGIPWDKLRVLQNWNGQ